MIHTSIKEQEYPLFDNIESKDLNLLLSCLNSFERHFAKNEMIILENDDITYIGVVRKGTVHMIKEDVWGHKVLLTYLTKGDLLGENFAVQTQIRSYVSYMAATDCDVLFLPAYNIIHSCPNQCHFHSQLTQNMFNMLGRKSVRLMEKIEVSSKPTLREKILAYFSIIAQQQNSYTIELSLSRTELAEFLGVNRSAMSRELSQMREDGLISFHKNTFQLTHDL